MSDNSKIEWTDATWNPVTGCTPVSAGCANCYAKRLDKRFPQIHGIYPFHEVRCHPDRLDQPLRWRKPRRIFVCSMGDLFHPDVPLGFIKDVWDVMVRCRQHTFMILTKRPARMVAALGPSGTGFYAADGPVPCPQPNVYLGVTAENQAAADERIPLLLQTPAAVRFVSCEPLLGAVDFRKVPGFNKCGEAGRDLVRNFWVICGGETGPGARPMHPDWARSLRDQCKAAGVPFFFKKMGRNLPTPDDLMIREFPKEVRDE